MSDRDRLAHILERIWDHEDPLAFLDEMRERHPNLAGELTPHREAVALITEAVAGPPPLSGCSGIGASRHHYGAPARPGPVIRDHEMTSRVARSGTTDERR